MPKTRLAVCAALLALAVTSCATDSPPQQKARERKAAGVALFHIYCNKDLWDYVEGLHDGSGYLANAIDAKVTNDANGLAIVEISGTSLVDLLQKLDYFAHGGGRHHDARAARMYDALAPRVDAIQTTPQPGAPVPEVTIDDHVGPVTTTPTATVSPKKQ